MENSKSVAGRRIILDLIKISKIEGIALILIIMVNQVVLGTPKIILANNSSGALINVIVISIIALLAVLAINYLFKPFSNSDIIDISGQLGNKVLKVAMSIFYILLFFLSSITSLYCMVEALKIIYFQNTSLAFLSLFFIVCMIFSIRKGFETISRVNLIIVILSLR